MSKIFIQTGDGEKLEVDKEVAMKSQLVKGVVEEWDPDGDDDTVPLMEPSIKMDLLKKVVEFLTKMKETNAEV